MSHEGSCCGGRSSRRCCCISLITNHRYVIFTLIVLLVSLFTLAVLTSFLSARVQLTMTISSSSLSDEELRMMDRPSFSFSTGRLDSSGKFKIHDFMWVGDKWENLAKSFNVCLATQGSIDRLHWLPQLSSHWDGPISLAVYVVSRSHWIDLNIVIAYLRKCVPAFRFNFVVHLVLPVEMTDTWNWEDVREPRIMASGRSEAAFQDCKSPQNTIRDFVAASSEDPKLILYPQNQLRNVATRGCGTPWIFSTDIDLIPRNQSAPSLNTFLKSKEATSCKKCAFVVPTLEVCQNCSYPATKRELVTLLEKGKARYFHYNLFYPGHKATDYDLWKTTHLDEGPIAISHDPKLGESDEAYYEPFSVAPAQIPAYPEMFMGYGYTRVSQMKAAWADGWKYKVLTPIFTVHWGLQNGNTVRNPGGQRWFQIDKNRERFQGFKQEMEFRRHRKFPNERRQTTTTKKPGNSTKSTKAKNPNSSRKTSSVVPERKPTKTEVHYEYALQ